MKLALMVGAPDMQPSGDFYVQAPLGPYHATLTRAARLGFDGVEILAAYRAEGDLRALREALAASGLAVAGVNSGRLLFDHGLALLCGTSKQCIDTRAAIYDLIRFSAPFSTHINIGTFRGMPAVPDHAPALTRLVGVLQDLADYAQRLGVDLLIEPQNKEEFPFITSTKEGIELVERVGRPNLGLMLDTFHMAVEHEDMLDSISRAMPYLRHIHFLDRDRNPPAPSTKGLDVPGMFRVLRRHNYRHYLSMPLVKDSADTATAEVVHSLRDLIAQTG